MREAREVWIGRRLLTAHAALVTAVARRLKGRGIHAPLDSGETALLGQTRELRRHLGRFLARRRTGTLAAPYGDHRVAVEEVRLAVQGLLRSRRAGGGLHRRLRLGPDWVYDRDGEAPPSPSLVTRAGRAAMPFLERRPLPGPDATLAAWFEGWPESWSVAVGILHGLVGDDGVAPPPELLAGRMLELEPTLRLLRLWFSHAERAELARYVGASEVPIANAIGLDAVLHDRLTAFPLGGGARLRYYGWVHVGVRDGRHVAVVPEPLRPLLNLALRRLDQGPSQVERRLLELVFGKEGRADPPPDLSAPEPPPDDDPWWEAQGELDDLIQEWSRLPGVLDPERVPVLAEVMPARARLSVAEYDAVCEHALLDLDDGPDGRPMAIGLLATDLAQTPVLTSLVASHVRAVPGLYHVHRDAVGIHDEFRVDPLLPPGPATSARVHRSVGDPKQCWLVAGRLHAAGPYTWLRPLGAAVPLRHEARVRRLLRRSFPRRVLAGTSETLAEHLRAHPEAFLRFVLRLSTVLRARRRLP
jgi:hypothetical protein